MYGWVQVHEQLEPSGDSSEASPSPAADTIGGFYARSNGGKNGLTGGSGRGAAMGWLVADRTPATPPKESGPQEAALRATSNEQASTADIAGRPVLYTSLRARCQGGAPALSGDCSRSVLLMPWLACLVLLFGLPDPCMNSGAGSWSLCMIP